MKALKGIGNGILIFIAVVLSIGIFGIEIGIHSVYGVKDLFTVEGIKETIKNIDVGSYLSDVDTDDDDLKDFYDSMDEAGVDSEIAKEIINSKEIKEIIGNYFSSSIEAILDDTDVVKPTTDEIMSIIENNETILEKMAEADGVSLTESQKEEYLSSLREAMPELIDQIPDIKAELGDDASDVREALNIVTTIFSPTVIFGLLVAVGVIYLIISLLRWSFHKAMLYLAVPTLVASVTVIRLATSLKFVKSALDVDKDLYNFLNKTVFPSLSSRLLISGLIGLVIGIILIAGYILIKKIPKKEKIVLN